MNIITTIIPVFAVVLIGWTASRKGFIPREFWEPANRLVFYIAIPAMIFQAISRASLKNQFDPLLIILALTASLIGYLSAWISGRCFSLPPHTRASFIQCCGHGNLGYIGLAVAFYYLGEIGLVAASIVAGFMMIVQNTLSVLVLQAASKNKSTRNPGTFIRQILANPVIVAALAGIVVSAAQIPIPEIVGRTLDIISAMALPTALLLIGAALSFDFIVSHMAIVAVVCVIKLVLMPSAGLALFKLAQIPSDSYIPAIILLASPTATISYVMGAEMGGDSDFAVAAISSSTLASAATFSIWLAMLNKAFI